MPLKRRIFKPLEGKLKKQIENDKFVTKGVEALSSKELLMVILGKGIKGRDVTVLATDILKLIEKEREDLTLEKLEKIQGVGKARAGHIFGAYAYAFVAGLIKKVKGSISY